MGLIYLIENRVNGKRYVGQTVKPLEARWRYHVWFSKNEANDSALPCAIRKYGKDAFNCSILQELPNASKKQLDEAEIRWISELQTHGSQGGYNCTLGGDGANGAIWSDERRAKHRAKMGSDEVRLTLSISHLGKRSTPETRAKQAASLTGITRSPETRAKMSVAKRGEKSATVKLTWDIVAKIREQYSCERIYHKDLAKQYDVSQATITRILRNEIWVIEPNLAV